VAAEPAAHEWLGDEPAHTLFQWHRDAFSLPPGAVRLAHNPSCPNQAFALGPHLAMQFHVEVDATKLAVWADEADAWPAGARAEPAWHDGARLRQDTAHALAASQALASRIYARWLRFAG
jgi:GMP synthase-like glutamine amidotransferase